MDEYMMLSAYLWLAVSALGIAASEALHYASLIREAAKEEGL